jgi:hypothetical protein
MKKLLLLLLTTFILSSCNKDDNPFSSKDQLPAETQAGANTVGCLINGQVYLPSQRGINSPINCQYEYINNEFFFIMSFSDDKNSGPNVSVQTLRINLSQGETYILNKNSIDNGDFTGGGGAYRLSSSNKYYTNAIKRGELKITRVDLSNSIISGTFWFDAINSNGEIVEIRSGRFDWNY